MKTSPLSLDTVRQARQRIADGLRVTPCAYSASLSRIAGMSLYVKRDYEQVTGSFKERGARNALLCLSPEARSRGVIAASAGNHALGLARHGGLLGVSVTVVMPRTAPHVKAERCRALGATVVLHGETFDQASEYSRTLAAERELTFVHPFDDPAVIAGQGTLGLEVAEQVANFDAIVVPVGGGGLIAGVATALKAVRPGVEVIGVEPAHAACFAVAKAAGRPVRVPVSPTLADGLAVAAAGQVTFAIASALADRFVTVTEDELATALWQLAESEGSVVEGAGAAALAACLSGKLSHLRGKRVVLLSGGRNVDPEVHARALRRARSSREHDRETRLACAG
ncbi:threonine ammonia-lyase [Opitutaceae bacterium EW11]|nr:threonine ammonia-lyase [Opitutaceae bacterium EW11]